MTAQHLLDVSAWLAVAAMSDVRQALAHAVAWLDPLYSLDDPYGYSYYDDESDFLPRALYICRSSFPDLYATVVHHIRQNGTDKQSQTLIISGINEQLGTEISDLEEMMWGIPLPFMGVDIEYDWFWDGYAKVVPVLACFGLTPESSEADRMGQAETIASALAKHLCTFDRPLYKNIAWLLEWLFSSSGNTLVDYSYDAWADGGWDYLQWIPNDIELAKDIIKDANQIMQAAMHGLDFLLGDDEFLQALQTNIQLAKEELERRDKGERPGTIQFIWPDRSEQTASDAPDAELGVLQLRDDPAPDHG